MTRSSLRFAMSAGLLCVSLGASAAPPMTRPLEITGVFQEKVGPKLQCPSQFGGALAGHGDSPSLGPLAFVGSDCITPAGRLFNFNGRFIILTQSGEQIVANYSGQFVSTGEGTKYTFSGATFQITGGTGRYTNASGGGTLSGGEDIATGFGDVKLAGKIHY